MKRFVIVNTIISSYLLNLEQSNGGRIYNMSNIFVSWSKAKSREFALEIKYLIESLDPHSNVFMSEENISAGEKVQEKIIKKIEECDLLLLCFTKENKPDSKPN